MKYLHDFDIVFCVENGKEDPDDCKPAEVIAAVERRLADLKANPSNWRDICGHVQSNAAL